MNPILLLLGCLAAFLGLVFGLGLPVVAKWRLPAPEKICAGAAVGVVLLYLFAMADYWLKLPASASLLVPLAAAGFLAGRWRACTGLVRDPDARRLLGAYLIVVGWCLGFLALVRSYSGGGWVLDWADHYTRAMFFLHHRPIHWRLFGGDQLPTRPPLVNAVTAVFLGLTSGDYPFFQIFTTLLCTLAFLPVWLFAGRFSRNAPRAQAVLAVLFMLNPSVMENSTFAWTKLPTVFLVLTGVYFFLPALAAGSIRRLAAAFLFLAAGILAHYSAGPYVVAIVAAYFWWRRSRWRQVAFWRETALCALPAALLLATWLGWSLHAYGARGTFLSNTSVTETTVHSWSGFLPEKARNVVNTLVPHPFRTVNYELIAQRSPPGFVRDYCFLLYQVSLPLMFGSAGGFTLIWLLWRGWREARPGGAPPSRGFWLWFIVCTTLLGTAAYGGIDQWGVAHLCLQGLLGLGLALLAARIDALPRWWRIGFTLGVIVDFALGVALQFYMENLPFSVLDTMHDRGASVLDYYSTGIWVNLWTKIQQGFEFVGDWPLSRPLLIALLAGLFALAAARLRRDHAAARPPAPSGGG
jgi:hypothetical protein